MNLRSDPTLAVAAAGESDASSSTSANVRFTAALQQIVEALSHAGDARAAIENALVAGCRLINGNELGLVERDAEARTVRCNMLVRQGRAVDVSGTELDRHWPIDERPIAVPWRRIDGGETFVWGLTSDATVLVPEVRHFHEEAGTRSVGYVPIRRRDETLGWLAASFRDPAPPSNDVQQLLHVLASHVALALHLARSAEAERRVGAEKRLAGLVEVHDALTRSLDSLASAPDIDQFLGEVLRIAAGKAGVELAHLWVHDAEGWVTLHRGYCQGVVFDRERSAAMPLAHAYERPFKVPSAMIHGESIFDRRRELLQDVLADEYAAQLAGPTLDVYRELGVQWELNVPPRFGGRCVAHLAVYLPTGREVTSDLVEMVHALGRQVTLAMELARLSAEARTAAVSRERDSAALERAAQHARATEALSETVAALRSAEDFEGFVPAVLGIVARAFGAASCSVYEFRGEVIYLRHWYMDGVVRGPEEIFALDPTKWELVRLLAGGFTVPPEYFPSGEATSERSNSSLIDHRSGTVKPDFDAFCCEHGFYQELNVPILVDGKPVGAMVIHRGPDRSYLAAEVTLAETLAAQLALAMEASRVAKAARERAVEIARLEETEATLARDLAREEKANAALQAMVDAVASLPTPDELIPVALGVVSRTFGVGDCAFYDVLPDQPIRLRFWHNRSRVLARRARVGDAASPGGRRNASDRVPGSRLVSWRRQ